MGVFDENLKSKEQDENMIKYVRGHIDGVVCDYIKFEFDENGKEKSKIISSVKTEEAVNFLQQCIENYSNYFSTLGLPVEKMAIDLYTEFFMQQEIANTADDEYKIKGVSPNKFLKDIVYIAPGIEIVSQGQNVSHKISPELESLQNSGFIVNYNELVSRLSELGYELNYQNYEQLLAGQLMQQAATFDIDFALENKKTR